MDNGRAGRMDVNTEILLVLLGDGRMGVASRC